MEPNIEYLQPMFSFGPSTRHIAVPRRGLRRLEGMVADVLVSGSHVAIYVPEGTDPIYSAGNARGRVVAVVKLLPLPSGHRMEDYTYNDPFTGHVRWCFGYLCETLILPPINHCPYLRTNFNLLFSGPFQPYVSRLQLGPFRLEPAMRDQLNQDFRSFS